MFRFLTWHKNISRRIFRFYFHFDSTKGFDFLRDIKIRVDRIATCKGFRFDFLRDIKMRDDRRIFCPLFILAIKYAPLPPSFKFYLAEPLLLTVVSPSYSNLPPLQISHLSTIFLSPPKTERWAKQVAWIFCFSVWKCYDEIVFQNEACSNWLETRFHLWKLDFRSWKVDSTLK